MSGDIQDVPLAAFRKHVRRMPAKRQPRGAGVPEILLHNSHRSASRPNGWSGAPGEAEWVMGLNDQIVSIVNARYPGAFRIVRVDGDLGHVPNDTVEAYQARHPEFARTWAAFIAPHYEANVHGMGGSCGGRATGDPVAARSDAIGAAFNRRFRAIPGVPPERGWCANPNVVSYYGFAATDAATPGWLQEHAVGSPDPTDYDASWLRAHTTEIASAWADTMAEIVGVSSQPTPSVDPRFAVLGPSRASAGQLRAYLASRNPTAPDVAPIYAELAAASGIRAEIAFGQACKETNFWRFTGTAKAEWMNPAGLGVTGAPDIGNRFGSWRDGITAQLQHLLWYVGATPHEATAFCTPTVDQRHAGAHKLLPSDVRGLSGKWAVPGTGYGESIADHADAIVATVAPAPYTPTHDDLLVGIWMQRAALGYNPWSGNPIDPKGPLPEYAKAPTSWQDPLAGWRP